jgi:hypothetical protein
MDSMKPLEIIYNTVDGEPVSVRVASTLQAIIDRLNELSEILTADKKEMTPEAVLDWVNSPKRFNDSELEVVEWNSEMSLIKGFKSKAEAQAALELLLNL